MTKKEHSIVYFLADEIKELGPYTLKTEMHPHYGLRHYLYTECTIYYKKRPVLYLDFTYEHFFRKFIKLRDVIECNRNVFTIIENDCIEKELCIIFDTLAIKHYDEALLEDFSIEDILEDNCVSLSEYALDKLERNIKKMNTIFNTNDKKLLSLII